MRRKLGLGYAEKLAAVKALLLGTTSTKEIVERFGIHKNTLKDWTRLYRDDVIQYLHIENLALKNNLAELNQFKETIMSSAFLVDDAGIIGGLQMDKCTPP